MDRLVYGFLAGKMIAAIALACSVPSGLLADSCKDALAHGAVCEAANSFAIDRMRTRHLEAISVVQNVATGAVVFAASQPQMLDVSTQLPPLSYPNHFLLRPGGITERVTFALRTETRRIWMYTKC